MSFSITQAGLIPAFQAGYCIGLQGGALPPPSTVPPALEGVPARWREFLNGVRSNAITSRGKRNEGAEACADAFVAAALETFPEAGDKVFLRTLSRLWGVRMSPAKNPLTVNSSAAFKSKLIFSMEIGRHGAKELRFDYEAGRTAGLGKTVLDAKLHLRDMDEYLRTSGWLLGTAVFLKNRFPERSDLLARNHASIIHRAFHKGQRSYPEDVVEFLPSMMQALDLEIARWKGSDDDAAVALQANRDSIINRALHSGNLGYPAEAMEAIPAMLKVLDGHPALRSNRASIVSRALNRGNFKYPLEAAKKYPELFAALDAEIARLGSDDSKIARILKANRGTIVMHALAHGNFRYVEEVVKELPRWLRALDREISRLSGTDPPAAENLRNNSGTIIDRAINSGVLKITGRLRSPRIKH